MLHLVSACVGLGRCASRHGGVDHRVCAVRRRAVKGLAGTPGPDAGGGGRARSGIVSAAGGACSRDSKTGDAWAAGGLELRCDFAPGAAVVWIKDTCGGRHGALLYAIRNLRAGAGVDVGRRGRLGRMGVGISAGQARYSTANMRATETYRCVTWTLGTDNCSRSENINDTKFDPRHLMIPDYESGWGLEPLGHLVYATQPVYKRRYRQPLDLVVTIQPRATPPTERAPLIPPPSHPPQITPASSDASNVRSATCTETCHDCLGAVARW